MCRLNFTLHSDRDSLLSLNRSILTGNTYAHQDQVGVNQIRFTTVSKTFLQTNVEIPILEVNTTFESFAGFSNLRPNQRVSLRDVLYESTDTPNAVVNQLDSEEHKLHQLLCMITNDTSLIVDKIDTATMTVSLVISLDARFPSDTLPGGRNPFKHLVIKHSPTQ